MDKDITDLIKWARSQGWEVTTTADGYSMFYTPAGDYAGRYPNTPSNPRRRMMDLMVALRKNGLEVPPPSKKEQRSKQRKLDIGKEEGK